jgi:hypothetical protein
MKTIHKFDILSYDFLIELPADAQFLAVQVQNGTPVMWFLLDTEAPKIRRCFDTYYTGVEIPCEAAKYLGTFQLETLVYHLFELE